MSWSKKKEKKLCIPLHTPVLLYKSGVQWGIHYTDMFSWWPLLQAEVGQCTIRYTYMYYQCHCEQPNNYMTLALFVSHIGRKLTNIYKTYFKMTLCLVINSCFERTCGLLIRKSLQTKLFFNRMKLMMDLSKIVQCSIYVICALSAYTLAGNYNLIIDTHYILKCFQQCCSSTWRVIKFCCHLVWNKANSIIEPWREKTGLRGFRPGLTQTGLYSLRKRLEDWNFGFKKKRNCTIRVAKTKALISFAVTAKLICAFVFA